MICIWQSVGQTHRKLLRFVPDSSVATESIKWKIVANPKNIDGLSITGHLLMWNNLKSKPICFDGLSTANERCLKPYRLFHNTFKIKLHYF